MTNQEVGFTIILIMMILYIIDEKFDVGIYR